ncbi:hypothetical protein Agau_C100511 [Agrobacterium tumefaciens F2]|nr:hypothetical protein Agau_C100511 [Agrobacterium tumefaciens F2]
MTLKLKIMVNSIAKAFIIIIDDVFVLYWKRGHALTADLFPQYRV